MTSSSSLRRDCPCATSRARRPQRRRRLTDLTTPALDHLCGRSQRLLADARQGRAPGARQPAIGSGLASASLEEQRRCHHCSLPCNSGTRDGHLVHPRLTPPFAPQPSVGESRRCAPALDDTQSCRPAPNSRLLSASAWRAWKCGGSWLGELHRDHDREEARDGRHAEPGSAGGGRLQPAGISSQRCATRAANTGSRAGRGALRQGSAAQPASLLVIEQVERGRWCARSGAWALPGCRRCRAPHIMDACAERIRSFCSPVSRSVWFGKSSSAVSARPSRSSRCA